MATTLGTNEHQRVFDHIIAPNALAGSRPTAQRPKAIIIAGMPGSGKGTLTAMARADIAPDGAGHVEIDIDALRSYHRAYHPLMLTDDRTAAHAVHGDVTRWGEQLRAHYIANKRHLIIDGTLKDPAKALTIASDLRSAGYETELRVIAMPKAIAVQGVYGRYENAKAQGRPARWVPEQVIAEAHLGVPRSVRALHERAAIDTITVYHRDASRPTDERGRLALRPIATVKYRDGRALNPPPPHTALRSAAMRALSRHERAVYRRVCKQLCEAIARRDAALTEPENARAFELAREHKAIAPNSQHKSVRSTHEHGGATMATHEDERIEQARAVHQARTRDADPHERAQAHVALEALAPTPASAARIAQTLESDTEIARHAGAALAMRAGAAALTIPRAWPQLRAAAIASAGEPGPHDSAQTPTPTTPRSESTNAPDSAATRLADTAEKLARGAQGHRREPASALAFEPGRPRSEALRPQDPKHNRER